jgi:type IV pilus assembly protein PilQ
MRNVVLILLILISAALQGQDRFALLDALLSNATVEHPGLEGTVEMSVSGTGIKEFVRAIGITHKLNLTVDPAVKGEVYNHFSDARVSDVLIDLCKRYDLDIEILGSIITLKQWTAPVQTISRSPTREPGIRYSVDSALLHLDLRRDTLGLVARLLSQRTGTNVVLAPGLEDRPVSIFLQATPVASALEQLAFANGMMVEPGRDGAILVRPLPTDGRNDGRNRTGGVEAAAQNLVLNVLESGRIAVDAKAVPLSAVLERASQALSRNYFLYDNQDRNVTLHLNDVSYEELVAHLLKGSDLTHQLSDGVHLIGKRDLEGLRSTELVRLHHRPVMDVIAAIPAGIRGNITISEFRELNGIVLSGDPHRITEVKTFLRSVDQVVPVVMIEVMIVDVNRTRTMTTGIKAGLGSTPVQSGGTVLSGVDYNMNSATLNELINSFNGFGVFNLGNVTSGFYVSIQALETDGVLRLRSTPQLSTLNGHEATLSIGQTEYYLEIRNDLIGTQNPTVTTSQVYKPIKADLSLKILPIVSSEDMVTLEIEVNQSNFTTRIAQTAPPGSVERRFSSIVRAGNRDMIILGGLEEKETSKNGSGIPLLSRIPVLKWLFSSRTVKNRKSKLTIFIRPTIIY